MASIRSSQLSYTRTRATTLAKSNDGVKTELGIKRLLGDFEYRHGQSVYPYMNRVKKHLLPKRRIAERLRRAGYRVQSISAIHGYDLLVNDRVRVALRVAFPRVRKHHVTVRGRHYTYNYRSWHFNFHHHGKFGKRYADVFVCMAMEPRHPSREEVFIIPWDSISGKTFSLHAARERYKGQYAQFVNRWSAIGHALEAPVKLRKVA